MARFQDEKPIYTFPLESFIDPQRFSRVKSFASTFDTPGLIVDLDIVKAKYLELRDKLPFVKIYYAVKANPMDEVIALVRDLGASFDVASRYELDKVLALGVAPDRVSYGNTIKKRRDIAYFYEKGVRLFATDSIYDLNNISDNAPGSKVFFRLLSEGLGADWPLSKKFGCHPDMARQLIKLAVRLGLQPYGISFHPGSQQRDVGQWSTTLTTVGHLFRQVKEQINVDLKMVNMGGGFPANYLEPSDTVASYAESIRRFLENSFDGTPPGEIIIEPGRSLVADSGIIVAEIVNIAKKSVSARYPWVFLDVGKFGGLIETLGEAIKYPIYFEGTGPAQEIIIAGPTCDSMDILYENWTYTMPQSAKIGDRIYIFTAGAYTQSYSSVSFNGIPPLRAYILR